MFRIIVPLNSEYSFDYVHESNEPKSELNEPKNEPNGLKNEPDLRLSGIEKKILSFIKEDSGLTQKQLSEKMDISLSTVKRILTKLKGKGILIHVGNKRSGKWEIRNH